MELRIDRAERVYALLVEVAGVPAGDDLLREDFFAGAAAGCLNGVHGEWRGLHYEAIISVERRGALFTVVAKTAERRQAFLALEIEVNTRLKQIVPPYQKLVFRPFHRLRTSALGV
jgi:hypothetical protein